MTLKKKLESHPRLATIAKQIVSDLRRYYDEWKFPLSYEVISRSYGVEVKNILKEEGGSLEDLISELENQELLTYTRTARGKKVLFPLNAAVEKMITDGTLCDLLVEYDESPIIRSRNPKGPR